ncbi:hypothetical protein GCM10010350_77070 [Streptomyces galilaeus]|nr:hypothetical protein GCM10010350_77070 [Streptomyces galilaeus]
MHGEAGGVLREDPGLDGPDPGRLGGVDQRLEQCGGDAAAPGAKPVSPSPTARVNATPSAAASTPSTDASKSDASPAASDTAADENDGMSSDALAGVIVVAQLVLDGGAWWLVKRRATSSSES